MKRMTKNNEYGEYQPVEQGKILFDCLNKLGELENIEEELGIELATLFKALKNGIWTRKEPWFDYIGEELYYIKEPEIGFSSYRETDDHVFLEIYSEENVLCIYTHDYEDRIQETRLKDYGKTWALTKEELKDA